MVNPKAHTSERSQKNNKTRHPESPIDASQQKKLIIPASDHGLAKGVDGGTKPVTVRSDLNVHDKLGMKQLRSNTYDQ